MSSGSLLRSEEGAGTDPFLAARISLDDLVDLLVRVCAGPVLPDVLDADEPRAEFLCRLVVLESDQSVRALVGSSWVSSAAPTLVPVTVVLTVWSGSTGQLYWMLNSFATDSISGRRNSSSGPWTPNRMYSRWPAARPICRSPSIACSSASVRVDQAEPTFSRGSTSNGAIGLRGDKANDLTQGIHAAAGPVM
jgi:hypothetical protein